MTKHYFAVGVLLIGTLLVHSAILNRQAEAGSAAPPESIQNIPKRIADYTQMGEDIEIDEYTLQVLETSSVLMRNYIGDRHWPLSLTIVYAGATRRSLHFPEVCLVGQGWEIREQATQQVGFLFTAKRLVLVNGGNQKAVLYWFKTGDKLTGNFFMNALHWTTNQIAFSTPTSAMFKVETPIGPGGEEAAFALLEDFAIKFHPVLMEYVP